MNYSYLRSLDLCDHGFESHSRHGCFSAFIVRLCRYRPCEELISRPRSPTDRPRIKKLRWNKAFHGCPMLQSGSNRRERERLLMEFKNIIIVYSENQLHLANTLFERNAENLKLGGIYDYYCLLQSYVSLRQFSITFCRISFSWHSCQKMFFSRRKKCYLHINILLFCPYCKAYFGLDRSCLEIRQFYKKQWIIAQQETCWIYEG
jgi:hypothetical protein